MENPERQTIVIFGDMGVFLEPIEVFHSSKPTITWKYPCLAISGNLQDLFMAKLPVVYSHGLHGLVIEGFRRFSYWKW